MNPDAIDLREAGYIYLVANTPLFLIRRLQEDPSIHLLRQVCGAQELYLAIERALQKDPQSASDAVRPFAYLIALRQHDSPETFYRAAELSSQCHPWFKIAARMLEATYIPNVNAEFLAPISMQLHQESSSGHAIAFDLAPGKAEVESCYGSTT